MSGRGGGRAVVCGCPFIPSEWVSAHGFVPRRLSPAPFSNGASSQGRCPYAQAFLKAALKEDAAAIVVSSRCDQMRRGSEWLEGEGCPPVFLLNFPATWQTKAAARLYSDELKRLGRFLERIGGRCPSRKDLAESLSEWDAARASVRAKAAAPRSKKGIPLGLIGGPLMAEKGGGLPSMVEGFGGRIVFDGAEGGERTLPLQARPGRIGSSPFAEMARIHFEGISDPCRRPDSMLYEWLGRMLESRRPKGLIMVRYIWCDLWHAQARRMREWAGVPFLEIDMDGGGASGASRQVRARIEAFLEGLA